MNESAYSDELKAMMEQVNNYLVLGFSIFSIPQSYTGLVPRKTPRQLTAERLASSTPSRGSQDGQ